MKQEFSLDAYKWKVKVFYLDGEQETIISKIEHELDKCGCRKENKLKALEVIEEENTGITFSNLIKHATVMVIGRTTSIEECANTMIHERKHLEYHICKAYDIDPFSEEAAYIAGDIGAKMYKCASVLLCKNCRKHYLSFSDE